VAGLSKWYVCKSIVVATLFPGRVIDSFSRPLDLFIDFLVSLLGSPKSSAYLVFLAYF
jgi:hypothetical protein